MRQILILLFIVSPFYTQAQEQYYGIDSVRNIEWNTTITMFYADKNGNDSVPCDYVRTEYDLTHYDKVVVVVCGKKEFICGISQMGIPKQFLYNVKASPENMVSQPKGSNLPLPDSIVEVDFEGLEQFYIDKKDSLQIDTLQVSDRKVLDPGKFIYSNTAYECYYKHNLKNGIERGYYKISELKDVCITGNFMIKYEGKWKAGEKHGKWKEYDKSGTLISVKKYKHGQFIKETGR